MKTWKYFAAILTFFAFVFISCPPPDEGYKNQTPEAADFNIIGTGIFTYDGSPKTVTVIAKAGKTGGAITVKYNEKTSAPRAVGT